MLASVPDRSPHRALMHMKSLVDPISVPIQALSNPSATVKCQRDMTRYSRQGPIVANAETRFSEARFSEALEQWHYVGISGDKPWPAALPSPAHEQ